MSTLAPKSTHELTGLAPVLAQLLIVYFLCTCSIRWIGLHVGTFMCSALLWGISAMLTACPHTVDTDNNVTVSANSTVVQRCDTIASHLGYTGQ